jgi:ParB-like chromosome segregation protein Spo0J
MDSKLSDDQNISPDMPPDHAVSYQTISLVDIDFEDPAFRITTRNDIDDLLGSIQKIGLLQPPVLMANSAGYTIVCGFRRIAACRKLGWTRIAAGILKKTVDRFKTAQLSIADNAFQRSLNLVETSRALKLLDDFGPGQRHWVCRLAGPQPLKLKKFAGCRCRFKKAFWQIPSTCRWRWNWAG